ncbi:unnamed protein product [Urochloa decumbens]|uniref:Uncharacterized protein n=1 Tax=Urochloa decumbens TaxID=240449 RepID=A0ABC9A1Y2_9POAL
MAAAAGGHSLSHVNPCVEFFFQVVPGTPPQRVRDLLAAAWAHDSLTALKLICNLGVTGTSDKEGFHAAVLWMHEYHPKTLACNLPALAECGYLEDLPELLFRLIHGPDARKLAKYRSRSRVPLSRPFGRARHLLAAPQGWKCAPYLLAETAVTGQVDPEMADAEEEHGNKTRKRARLAAQALRKYNDDREYQFLLDQVAQLFANLLKSDIQNMRLHEYNKIGLAAKWCPTPCSLIHTTLLCQAIARCLFPRNSDSNYADLPEEQYTYRVLCRLHHEVLVPLRRVLQLPEVYLSSRPWTKLDGKVKLTAVLPQTERQWRVMVDSLHEKKLLKNCMAVCDMSKSMEGVPMEVCTALGLLISELGKHPWAGRVITFSRKVRNKKVRLMPKITMIKGRTLRGRLSFLQKMQCDSDLDIDFQGLFAFIFQSILSLTDLNLEKDDMIKTVFVFTNKELDEAHARPWTQEYQEYCRKFEDAGYRAVVPQIVFWNLEGSRSTAVMSKLAGVMTLRGFSNNLLKSFLKNNGLVYPEYEMSSALAREEYKNLSPFD